MCAFVSVCACVCAHIYADGLTYVADVHGEGEFEVIVNLDVIILKDILLGDRRANVHIYCVFLRSAYSRTV